MNSITTIRGYTSVLLVLNMKRFIAEECQATFERKRGTHDMAHILREIWPPQVLSNGRFEISYEKLHNTLHQNMTREQIGFATGIFRSYFLEKFAFPTYCLNKEKIDILKHLSINSPSADLYLSVWDSWKIFVQPTLTGMFIIRLTKIYSEPTPLLQIGQDTLQLQQILDMHSAKEQLIEIRKTFANDPVRRLIEEKPILKFLDWFGADVTTSRDLLFSPVQWKLAMEACKFFIQDVNQLLQFDWDPIKLVIPDSKLSYPISDSFILYHIDEMVIHEKLIHSQNEMINSSSDHIISSKDSPGIRSINIRPHHVRASKSIQHDLAGLLNSAILRRSKVHDHTSEAKDVELQAQNYFPHLESGWVDKIFDADTANWKDELCLLTSQVAILMPSYQSRGDELLFTLAPNSLYKIPSIYKWRAIERMLEFIIEATVVSRLLELASLDLLNDISEAMAQVQLRLFAGEINLGARLPSLISHAADLKRLMNLCQSLCRPLLWSRAEYSVRIASYLLEQSDVSSTLAHAERNIGGINDIVNHIDELYATDLAEEGNDMSTVIWLGSAVSVILTLLALPSFWVDLQQVNVNPLVKSAINIVGTFFAFSLVAGGVFLGSLALRNGGQIIKIMYRSLLRLRFK